MNVLDDATDVLKPERNKNKKKKKYMKFEKRKAEN